MARDTLAFAIGLAVFVALWALYWLAVAARPQSVALGVAIVCFGYAVPLVAGRGRDVCAGIGPRGPPKEHATANGHPAVRCGCVIGIATLIRFADPAIAQSADRPDVNA